MKIIFILSGMLVTMGTAFTQVNIDKAIELTGTDADAKISGIRNVSASGDATSAEVIQKGTLVYAEAGGIGNDLTVDLVPPVDEYVIGMLIRFRATSPGTIESTLNVNGLGPIPIKKEVALDLAYGDFVAGQIVSVVYDGTNFQLISPIPNSGGGCAVPAQPGTISGPPAV